MTDSNNEKVEKLLAQIDRESDSLFTTKNGKVEIIEPTRAVAKLNLLGYYLTLLIDPLSNLERGFRVARAKRLDKFLSDGIKKTPAIESLKFEVDLIEMEVAMNRVHNYIKMTQQLISTFQTTLRLTASTNV